MWFLWFKNGCAERHHPVRYINSAPLAKPSLGLPCQCPVLHERMLKARTCNFTLMAGGKGACAACPQLGAPQGALAWRPASFPIFIGSSYISSAFPHTGANRGYGIHHTRVCFCSWLTCLISKILRQEAIMSCSLENYAQLTIKWCQTMCERRFGGRRWGEVWIRSANI